MKQSKLLISFLFLLALGISCTDTSKYPLPFDTINQSNAGILKQIAQTSVTFNKLNIAASKYEVVLEANDRDRGKLFTQVKVYVKFVDRTPANGDASKAEKVSPIKTYQSSEFVVDATTGLPRVTVTILAPAVLTFLGLLGTDLEGSDQFVFRQEMIFPDGKIFTSTNVKNSIASGAVYRSPFLNTVSVVCPSDLGGVISYSTVVTAAVVPIAPCLPVKVGTTTFTVTGPGKYAVGDATFGQYACAWNDNPAAGTNVEDACNVLAITGSDQYGLLYAWVIVSNNGTQLVINWSNDYGDKGTSTLTRTGGWPLGLTF